MYAGQNEGDTGNGIETACMIAEGMLPPLAVRMREIPETGSIDAMRAAEFLAEAAPA